MVATGWLASCSIGINVLPHQLRRSESTQIEKNNNYSIILIVLVRAYPHEVTSNKSEKTIYKRFQDSYEKWECSANQYMCKS